MPNKAMHAEHGMSDCGTIYTVFYNPTTGKYAGAHVSSEQDDD